MRRANRGEGFTPLRPPNPIGYRVRQFGRALVAPLDQRPLRLAAAHLGPGEYALFRRMSPAGRRHGADVARTLLEQGHGDWELLAAALLHDAGKETGLRLGLVYRVAVVLLSAFWPGALAWLAEQPWGRGFRVYRDHPQIGAELAEAAGSGRLTVELIRWHQEPPGPEGSPQRQALWLADNRN